MLSLKSAQFLGYMDLRTPTIYHLCHLCAKNFHIWWKFDKVLAKIILHMFFETRCILWQMLFGVGTIYLTVLVTVNRYVAVCRPYAASDTNTVKRQARIHVALVATFSILFNITRFFEWEIEDTESGLRAMPTWLTQNFLYGVSICDACC